MKCRKSCRRYSRPKQYPQFRRPKSRFLRTPYLSCRRQTEFRRDCCRCSPAYRRRDRKQGRQGPQGKTRGSTADGKGRKEIGDAGERSYSSPFPHSIAPFTGKDNGVTQPAGEIRPRQAAVRKFKSLSDSAKTACRHSRGTVPHCSRQRAVTLTTVAQQPYGTLSAEARHGASSSTTVCLHQYDSLPSSVQQCVFISLTACFQEFGRLSAPRSAGLERGLYPGLHPCRLPVGPVTHPGSRGPCPAAA